MAFLTHRPAAGNMLQGFGPRPKPTPTSPAIHYGQDYGWGGGDNIYAARDGVVIDYYYSGAYGNRLRIAHGNGVETWYCHTSRAITFKKGQAVKGGQHVAVMGATGNVTAKHLHFELRINGSAVNPAPYFSGTSAPAGGTATPINTYSYGLTVDAQRYAQDALEDLNFYDGVIDGYFGKLSVVALQKYLKSVKLLPATYVADGVPGPSYGAAVQKLAAKHGYTGAIDGKPGAATSAGIIAWAKEILADYGFGLSATAQRNVQEALKKLKVYGGAIDGKFGELSVRAFQTYLKQQKFLPSDYVIDGVPGAFYGQAVQKLAAKHGYDGPIDGVIGAATSEALVAWAKKVLAPVPAPQPEPVQPPTQPIPVPPVIIIDDPVIIIPQPEPIPATGAFGIDVATTQKDIDFAKAKADGVEFVIVKMGGLNVKPQYTAPAYYKQISGARAQGLRIGHYYLIGAGQSPVQQADYFVDHLYDFRLDRDVLALDNEALDANGIVWNDAQAAEFFRRVMDRTGIPASRLWHYAGANDYRTHKPWPQLESLGVRIWWAAYGANPAGRMPDHTPALMGSISDWDIHQFSSRVSVAGLAVDGNYSRLSVEQLFAKGEVIVPVPEPLPDPQPEPAPIPAPPAEKQVGVGQVIAILTALGTSIAGLIALAIQQIQGL